MTVVSNPGIEIQLGPDDRAEIVATVSVQPNGDLVIEKLDGVPLQKPESPGFLDSVEAAFDGENT